MKILCDLISFQSGFSGGGEYTKRICKELSINRKLKVFGLYDSNLHLNIESQLFVSKYDIQLIDISKKELKLIVEENCIDKIFVGVPSLFFKYNFRDVSCKIIVTVHDLRNHELLLNHIRGRLVYRSGGFKSKIKQLVARLYPSFTYKWAIKSIDEDLLKKENVFITTVSNYSKVSILYYMNLTCKDIPVFYPPFKDLPEKEGIIQNDKLRYVIESKKKYFLLVSGNVPEKNIDIFLNVFKKISIIYPSFHCVLTGIELKSENDKIISVGYLSTSDLEYAYSNAFIFVYPTYQEGFGYPPLEAMKYGVPCCVSNVTSLPEVYGDSVVYFSPFYEVDVFDKIQYLIENEKNYRKRSIIHYEMMRKRMDRDLKRFVDYILSV